MRAPHIGSSYVFGNGIAEPGDAKNHTETLLDAYNLGKAL